MKVGSLLSLCAVSCGLLFEPQVRGAGADDIYLQAYLLIQEGDKYANAQPDLARRRYDEALEILKKLQASYPEYNKNVVGFRSEYVQNKLKDLPNSDQPAKDPAAGQSGLPSVSGRQPDATAAPVDAVNQLQEQVTQLQSENATLQAKLQEALGAQPAAIDPRELAEAQEKIRQLEKEKELLRASADQAQAKQPQAAELAMLDQVRAELETTRKQLVENVATVAQLSQENQRLEQQLTAAKAQPAAPSADAEARVKELEKERDSLARQLAEAKKDLSEDRGRGQSSQYEVLTNQLSNLRARLEVFEARKVPYTKEELALLNTDAPKLAPATGPKAAKRPARELPAGAGLIVIEAERAFAARRLEEAEQKYQQVLEMDEKNPVSLANVALIQIEREKFADAEANLKKALSINPEDSYALSLMGMLRFNQGKYEEALDALSRSAQLDPNDPETQNYLGITLSQLGQREPAETALRKAVTLNPNFAGGHHNLAVIYATQRPPFLELARFHYNKALGLGHPANPDLEKQLSGNK